MAEQVSIIDDNKNILSSLALQFQAHGYSTSTFSCPIEALNHHTKKPADIYIIDIRMPKLTGIEFYKALCNKLDQKRVPALFLTGVDNLELECLKNTTIGDYVLKPFKFDILHARVKKILSYFQSENKNKEYKVGNLELFEDKIMATWFQNQIELTKTEFIIVFQLARRPFVVFSRGQLLDICYPNNYEIQDRNIDSHIKRIRQKFREVHPGKNFDRIHDCIETTFFTVFVISLLIAIQAKTDGIAFFQGI